MEFLMWFCTLLGKVAWVGLVILYFSAWLFLMTIVYCLLFRKSDNDGEIKQPEIDERKIGIGGKL